MSEIVVSVYVRFDLKKEEEKEEERRSGKDREKKRERERERAALSSGSSGLSYRALHSAYQLAWRRLIFQTLESGNQLQVALRDYSVELS